jgi:hypothetical protein
LLLIKRYDLSQKLETGSDSGSDLHQSGYNKALNISIPVFGNTMYRRYYSMLVIGKILKSAWTTGI